MANGNMQPPGVSPQVSGGTFIQPYPTSQTAAKDIILAKKGIANLGGEVTPYTRNLFLTLYAQERYNGSTRAT